MALQFNYLTDKGAFLPHSDGTYSVDFDKIGGAVSDLTGELLTIEATGDYAKGKDMLGRLGIIRPAVRHRLDAMQDLPVDIEPRFVTAEQLVPDAFAPTK